jgi:hypothetical protein
MRATLKNIFIREKADLEKGFQHLAVVVFGT